MRTTRWVLAAALATLGAQTHAQGLDVPPKNLPVPDTVSPQVQKLIGAPRRTAWDVLPKTGEEWKPVAEAGAANTVKALPGLIERMKVKVEKRPLTACARSSSRRRPLRRPTATAR
jgi:hypothetical protein